MPPHPTETHQRVLDNLYASMRAYVKDSDLGIIRFAPLPVQLRPGKIREPDILFVAHEHADRIGEQAYGPPDLVVEVISPGTERVDRGTKFLEYARAGIAEYWIVDPEDETIEVFTLDAGAYTLHVKAHPGESAHSPLLDGFEAAADDVFAP